MNTFKPMPIRMRRNEQGAVVIIISAILSALLSLAAYLYYTTSTHVLLAQLQTAADAAVIAGAESLCGTQECFDESFRIINKILEHHSALGTRNGVRNLAGEPAGPGGCDFENENSYDCTTNKNLKIRIERGIWYPDANGEFGFRSLESDAPAKAPGLPATTVANAFRLEISRPEFGSLLTFPWLGNPKKEVKAEAIAKAGDVQSMCIAPFAIPICALHDADGTFQDKRMCAGDRIFTRADRYCPSADEGDCGLYPSFPYGPCSKAASDTSEISVDRHYTYNGMMIPLATPGPTPYAEYEPARLHTPAYNASLPDPKKQIPLTPLPAAGGESIGCYSVIQPNPMGYYFKSIPPNPQQLFWQQLWDQYNQNISDWSPPFFANSFGEYSDSPSNKGVFDNFGVVGLPGVPVISSRQILDEIQAANPEQWKPDGTSCAFQAKVGDKFYVLPSGLTDSEPETENIIWDAMVNRKGSYAANASEGYPAALDTDIGTMEYHQIRAVASAQSPMRGDGLCRSRRSQMNVFARSIPAPPNGIMDWWHRRDLPLYLEPPLPVGVSMTSVPLGFGDSIDTVLSPLTGGGSAFYKWIDPRGAPAGNPVSRNFRSAENFSGPRAVIEVGPSQTALVDHPVDEKVTDNTPVWQVIIPVIADLSPDAGACQGFTYEASTGVEEISQRDPMFNDPNRAYDIVKFIRVNIYDVDIGPAPADDRGPLTQEFFSPVTNTPAQNAQFLIDLNNFRQNVITPPVDPVSPGSPGPNGWYFHDNNGAPLACNLVRARINCGSRLTTHEDELSIRIASLAPNPEPSAP